MGVLPFVLLEETVGILRSSLVKQMCEKRFLSYRVLITVKKSIKTGRGVLLVLFFPLVTINTHQKNRHLQWRWDQRSIPPYQASLSASTRLCNQIWRFSGTNIRYEFSETHDDSRESCFSCVVRKFCLSDLRFSFPGGLFRTWIHEGQNKAFQIHLKIPKQEWNRKSMHLWPWPNIFAFYLTWSHLNHGVVYDQ